MYQEVAQQPQQELVGPAIVHERSMFNPRGPPPTAAGAPSDREDYDVSLMVPHGGGGALGAENSGYEYEVKRQRLLQGGSAAASGMLNPYYQSQQSLQSSQPDFSSSSSVALQSSIAASLNSYFAATAHMPPAQHHGAPSSASSMYPSYAQHTLAASGGPSNPLHSGVDPSYPGNPVPGYSAPANTGLNPNHMTSGAALSFLGPSSANANPSYMNNSGRGLNPMSSTHYSSSTQISPFPATVSSAPPSGIGTYSTGSPSGLSGHPSHHASASPPPPPLPMMPFEQRSPHLSHSPPRFMPFAPFSGSFPVVRIRGLPFNCTESDVYDFFRGLDVVDVLLTHKQGRFSGEAYCVFGLPMQVDLALHRNRKSMGQRYIEVFRSKKHEYYLAVAAEVSEQDRAGSGEPAASFPPKSSVDKDHLEHTGVLKLRGLPFSASKRDVIEFFKGFNLKDEKIQFVVHSDGRASGEAFVEFDGPSESKLAMARDKMMLGSRYIELFPSSSEEAAKATGRHKK